MRRSRKVDSAFVGVDRTAHLVSVHRHVASGEDNIPTWLRMGPDREPVSLEIETDGNRVALAWS